MSPRARAEQESGRQHTMRREAARVGFAAAFVCVCAAGCAAVLGIDEPNVVGGDGGSDAQAEAQVAEAAVETGAEVLAEVGVESGVDDGVEVGADAEAEGDAPRDSAGVNVITNGDFSMGQLYWQIVSGTGGITTSNGKLCVSVASGQNAVLGWTLGHVVLGPGVSYTFQYRAMATPAVAVEATVAPSATPFMPIDFDSSDAVSTSFSEFTHAFTEPSSTENSAGLSFLIPQTGTAASAETVCLQDVSLVEN